MAASRIDYYDDPKVPKANSLVPSVNVVVVDEADDILLIRRSDNDNGALPGGLWILASRYLTPESGRR